MSILQFAVPSIKLVHMTLCFAGQMRLVTLELSLMKKLNFNSHVSAFARKAHFRASLLFRTYTIRDLVILTKVFVTYVRLLLEYCTSVWSPHVVNNRNKIESYSVGSQSVLKVAYVWYAIFWSTCMSESGVSTMQIRRLKCDLLDCMLMCYQITHNELECGPMPNVMVALPNIGGALCSTPQSLADAHY